MWQIVSNSPETTALLGEWLGQAAEAGLIVFLQGDLGAGKTHFAQGVARGLGITEPVNSPTFTIINEYRGRLPFYHMDLYRLTEPEEGLMLGIEEYWYGDGVSLVEWPERLEEYWPTHFLQVEIQYGTEENQRYITVTAFGALPARVLACWRQKGEEHGFTGN
ncbi:MAG: tRNA (adenosine(37)-N6)-threonylcarbamoyltransferase complex ATPase subunit type 1 TsaE [Bacillota bacterium]|uniref:tRNA threonylcarbamoyladenosine biosynthesis protein TsaE n=2 Tax=Carboxydocella TaxID=178898 RepID=A0A1T4RY47_9FIRM|nr:MULTISPECIES: tRNA (adenosine(37)-N6)-threonylcarbamoyltransferase complex ATPase subunit type 1 TsaE [Carboxydocella]AVX21402.1 tRNA threonylcarbamoyladenosine biosynthesis protein TsaE [Carboxydocella thermautotrophica]GAW28482.1 tRNA (adenosine(37)-N6)-threonylcarbamoyltransferase complex ATPase subunit type 1 TsaE [Carboxydocella sp. ULO1]GAW32380.1 tRNA (adenosine(37)-N6)-threonylcarbamoyltransferase complex ATPase subunit type 1 TsaE [Carboxydocella sp. JDF658]SKA20930.1 tRNA threonylc